MKEFAIIAQQRSGTAVLTELLNANARFYVATEIFHPGEDQPDSFLSFCAERLRSSYDGSLSTRRDLFGDFVQDLRARRGAEFVGYNVKYASCHNLDGDWRSLSSPPALFEILETRGAAVIHLVRTNVFKSALSNLRASETDIWHLPAGGDAAIARIEIDVCALLRLIELTQAEIETATKWLFSFPRLLTAHYDDMFEGDRFNAEFIRKLNRFVGLTGAFSDAPALTRLVPGDWREGVSNWRDVESMMNLNFPRICID
jgi:hypothetical protein